jgi:hypothetical protein
MIFCVGIRHGLHKGFFLQLCFGLPLCPQPDPISAGMTVLEVIGNVMESRLHSISATTWWYRDLSTESTPERPVEVLCNVSSFGVCVQSFDGQR